jgi:hypothetical protein
MRAGASFDPETIDLLRRTLDRCWDELRPYQRANISKTLLAKEFWPLRRTASALRSDCAMLL